MTSQTQSLDGQIKKETEKALLLLLINGKEVWIPKSLIFSSFESSNDSIQSFEVALWFLEKKNIHSDLLKSSSSKISNTEQGSENQVNKDSPDKIIDEKPVVSENFNGETIPTESPKSLTKKMKRGVKKRILTSEKRKYYRKWKRMILHMMTMTQIKQLCKENKIRTKKIVYDSYSEYIPLKKRECSKSELILKLQRTKKVSLDAIISFARRYRHYIKDILQERAEKQAEWDKKELAWQIEIEGSNPKLELVKTILDFKPLQRYDKELYYHGDLASFLQAKYSNTEIEVMRGSTRPDIVVNGISIEVKGPTSYLDLQTIADKCLRYQEYYPKGLICVLFDVNITAQRFEDWRKALKSKYPEVEIIRKDSS